MVKTGKPAPNFALTGDSGEQISLADLRGKPIVLFYPKDDRRTRICRSRRRSSYHHVKTEP